MSQRRRNSNKGDFGHILIIAGSYQYSGAALLCAEAAMRSGAGLVTLAAPKSLSLLKRKIPEVMLLALPETKNGELSPAAFRKIIDYGAKADVVALGPGMGKDRPTQELIRKLAKTINKPMVIDADGLNALTGHPYSFPVIMTPHPGEMARLSGENINFIQKNRKAIAQRFAKEHKAVLVLKGNKTVVADPSAKVFLNNTGNPGMSTAGSGDVLTGIIAAFLGQGLTAYEAAKYGVYIHGLAGDLAAQEYTEISLIASDIIAKIPEAVKRSS